MKIKKDMLGKDTFTPFSLTFTFESSKEADVFFCIFNHTTITDWLRQYMPGLDEEVRNSIGDVDYSRYHNELNSRITGR